MVTVPVTVVPAAAARTRGVRVALGGLPGAGYVPLGAGGRLRRSGERCDGEREQEQQQSSAETARPHPVSPQRAEAWSVRPRAPLSDTITAATSTIAPPSRRTAPRSSPSTMAASTTVV